MIRDDKTEISANRDDEKYVELVARLKRAEIYGGRNAIYDKEWVEYFRDHIKTPTQAITVIKLFLDAINYRLEINIKIYRVLTLMKILPFAIDRILREKNIGRFILVVIDKCVELTVYIQSNCSQKVIKQSRPIFRETFHKIVRDTKASSIGISSIEKHIEMCLETIDLLLDPATAELGCILAEVQNDSQPKVQDDSQPKVQDDSQKRVKLWNEWRYTSTTTLRDLKVIYESYQRILL